MSGEMMEIPSSQTLDSIQGFDILPIAWSDGGRRFPGDLVVCRFILNFAGANVFDIIGVFLGRIMFRNNLGTRLNSTHSIIVPVAPYSAVPVCLDEGRWRLDTLSSIREAIG